MSTRGALGMILVLIGTGAESALADPPPPSFQIDFAGDSAIWNPFEDFVACESALGATLCVELFDMACDGRGNCTGAGELSFSGVLDGTMSGPVTAKARCKQTNNPERPVCPQTRLKLEAQGTVTNGESCTGTIRLTVNGPVDAQGFYDGKGRASLNLLCTSGRFRTSVRGLFQYPVNPPTPWTLWIDILQDGRRLQGTAMDSLGFSYTARGSYSDRNDESKIAVRGERDTESRGATVLLKNLTTTGSSVTSGSAKISVQGNRSTAELGP